MPGLLPNVDPDGLLEYSVVYTDRARNHMSSGFGQVMNDLSRILGETYNADAAVIVPGSGTFAMEAVARQFATGKDVLVVRNGWFSYRWSQIFDMGSMVNNETVMKARRVGAGSDTPRGRFAPCPIDEVVAAIGSQEPDVVFAPHVETASGMMLTDDYIKAMSDAVHEVGGLMVLDCIASGTVWVDMVDSGVDVLISAPQKGWSGPPCAGLVMLSEAGHAALGAAAPSTSFACDLRKWREIMHAFEMGAHAYHATMPTDSLTVFRDVALESESYGMDRLRGEQVELGTRVRSALADRGVISVAADGWGAPGVVVGYTDDPGIKNGSKFAAEGMQIAGGVPLMCDEGDDFSTFRLGLFGLDKLRNIDRTVASLERVLDRVL